MQWSEVKAKSILELNLKISKQLKKESRDHELFVLQSNISQGLKNQIVKDELEYREVLDEDIKKAKKELLEANNDR